MKLEVTTKRGRVDSVDREDGNYIGEAFSLEDRTYHALHWTSWHSRVPGQGPRVGDAVELIFNSRGELVGARPMEDKDEEKKDPLKVELDLTKYPEHARLRRARVDGAWVVAFFNLIAEKGWTLRDRSDDDVEMDDVLCAQLGISPSRLETERQAIQAEALSYLRNSLDYP